MKVLVSALLTIFLIALAVVAQTSPANVEGNWLGTLQLGDSKLRLVLKISKSANGYSAKLDSLDQGATDLAIDSIALDGNRLTFSGAQLGLSYEGTLKETRDEITGTFKQGPTTVPLVLKRTAEGVEEYVRLDLEENQSEEGLGHKEGQKAQDMSDSASLTDLNELTAAVEFLCNQPVFRQTTDRLSEELAQSPESFVWSVIDLNIF
ncbi:MAG TPA: hypothetical protein VFR12_12580, partial [Pyrinomonadaceae bacterium]|nr:hypothetical protein [Pyrinomonadaceae bacterium]